jgi:tRNA dimethylallyltransferase
MRAFAVAFTSVIDKGKIPIFSGGSGMYLDAILSGYELSKVPNDNSLREEMSNLSFDKLIQRLKSYGPLHNISDITSDERLYRAIEIAEFQFKNRVSSLEIPEFNSINFGIMYNLDDVRNRIEKRLIQRIDEGMVDEVKRLIDEGLNPDDLIYYGLEYKFVTNYITGKVNFKQMYNQLNIAIGQFAKKQMTWFRKMEKKGVKIIWIDGQISESEKIAFMLSKLKS